MAAALNLRQRQALIAHVFLMNTVGDRFNGDNVLADLDRLLPGVDRDEVMAGCIDYQAIVSAPAVREWLAEMVLESTGGLIE